MKKKEQLDKLVDNLQVDTVFTISCNHCDKEDRLGEDSQDDALAEIYKLGWRTDEEGYSICKKCRREKK